VTLNSIGENRVRSIDKQTIDTMARHTRVQSSREARPSDLGIDVDQDLLRAITGAPVDAALGKTLTGVESLHAMVKVDLASLRALLVTYLDQFAKDSYKKSFAWVDQVAEVTAQAKILQLDEALLAKVADGEFERCWLAMPEPIDWASVAGFRYRRGTRQPILHDIGFDTFLESVPDADQLTIGLLQKREVHCVGADDLDIYSWPLYKCVYCELDVGGSTYLLNAGKWYCVTKSFVKQVNEEIKKLPKFSRVLPEFQDETEGQYNKRVAESDPKTFALMDAKQIPYGGGHSSIEFCDLYTDAGELIHVKRYGGSGVLSHLFSQGSVSGALFVTEVEFRNAVNALLPSSHKFTSAPRPDTSKYTIVFAIVSLQKGEDLTLPFFSRLRLRDAAKLLRGFGYKVALAKIHVTDTVAKTRRYRSGK
jgi:uncharacterized protein (TIGR04141 family)